MANLYDHDPKQVSEENQKEFSASSQKKRVNKIYINDTFGMAKDLVKTGASLEIVALILDLSEETIAELKKETNG